MQFEFNIFKFNDKVRACIWEHTQRYRFAADEMIYKMLLDTNTDWSKYDRLTPGGNKMSDALSKSTQKLFDAARPSFDEQGDIDMNHYMITDCKEVIWMRDYIKRFCKRFGKEVRILHGEVTKDDGRSYKYIINHIPWKFNAVGSYVGKGDFTEEYLNRILAKHGLVAKRDSRKCYTRCEQVPEAVYWCIHPAPKTCSRAGCNDAIHEAGRCVKHYNDLLATRAKRAAKGK